MANKNDPFRAPFDCLEKLECFVNWSFYATTLLSILASCCSVGNDAKTNDASDSYLYILSIVIVFISIIGFGVSIYIREYKYPWVQDKRVRDNFSRAFGATFGDEKTYGYYNNPFHDPELKVAAHTLENIYFTKEILSKILIKKTIVIFVYILVVIFIAIRSEIPKIVIAFQFLISEPIAFDWIKTLWLRHKCSTIYDYLVGIFKGKPDSDFKCKSYYSITAYEMAKAHAGIILSSKVFDEMNPILSEKWDRIIVELAEKVKDS